MAISEWIIDLRGWLSPAYEVEVSLSYIVQAADRRALNEISPTDAEGNVMFPKLISYKEIHSHEHRNRERVAKHDADPTRGMDPANVAIRSTEGK